MANVKIQTSEHPRIRELHKQGMKPLAISKQYGVIDQSICNILKRYGELNRTTSRVHFYNDKYFDQIDTEEKAYFLGLIFADGNNNRQGMTISLAEPDQYILEHLRDALGFKGTIKTYKKRKSFHKQKHVLCVHSIHLSNRLTEVGCPPNKSLILQFPREDQVKTEFMPHFLRGYFDGDGSIHFTSGKEKKLHWCITSSPDFCAGFGDFLERKFGFRGTIHLYHHSKAQSLKLSTRMALLVSDYIYEASSIRMTRKFNRFVDFLKIYTPINVGGTNIPTEKVIEIRDKWLAYAQTSNGLLKDLK